MNVRETGETSVFDEFNFLNSAIVNKMSSENEINYVINQLLETKVRLTMDHTTIYI